MKNGIILGIGVLILLLTLVGPASAHFGYQYKGANCGFCHVDIVNSNYALTNAGSYFRDIHKFDGTDTPFYANSCLNCHTDLVTFLPLTSNGSLYNVTHRYNETTLASKLLAAQWNGGITPAGGCNNCHVDVAGNATGSSFDLRSGTPTYLTSVVCQDCHKPKYDNWTNTLHRVMLTPVNKAQAMNIPLPPQLSDWSGISFVLVTKFQFSYINTTGYWLAQNNTYNTETQAWANSETASGPYGTCGSCHTTGWNGSAVNTLYPGIKGTFSEPGIACERCHGPAGNGHQVVVNYSAKFCEQCHSGSHHGTGYDTGSGEHQPPAVENGSDCMHCHSPFDKYKNPNVTLASTIAVSCPVCHNIHNMTDIKYADTFSNGNFNADTWSEVANANIGFFNATASLAAGTDIIDTLSTPALLYPGTDTSRKDSSYGTAPINVTGPVSEVLCSKCHYRHGLAHTAGVNLTHSRMNYPQSKWATCTDCHMKGTNATIGHDMMMNHALNIFDFQNAATSASADPANSCGGTTKCHIASSQNLSASSHSIVPVFNGWNASAHNDKVVSIGGAIGNHFFGTFNATTGFGNQQPNTCLQCKSPQNWNPVNKDNVTKIPLTDFHGVTCMVCHNLHDMGDWLKKTKAKYGVAKAYGFYNKSAIVAATDANGVPTRYKAAYTMMDNTTQLCGNCHTNIRAGNTGPGWASATAANPIGTHGVPAADVFAGSWKQTSLLNFECIDCHWSTNIKDSNGSVLPDSQKVAGHSFKVNVTLLQNDQGTQPCSNCHATGSALGNLSTTIANVQASTHAKWNNTNATVMSALATIKAYSGEKNLSRTLIATAYWNIKLVSSEGSWGVHNPTKDSQLLSDAATLANQSIAALGSNITPGPTNVTQTTDPLVSGYNLIAVSLIPDPTIYASNLLYTTTGGIPGVTKVMRWNSSAQQWEGYEYIAAAGVYLGNNFALQGYKAYFIKGNASTAGQTYTFRGRRQ